MLICEGLEGLHRQFPQGLKASAVTVGNFDGVHRGHQKLLQSLVAAAEKYQVPSLVLTFEPHPLKILYPEKNLFRLFPIEDQATQISQQGVDILLRLTFDRKLADTTAEDFFNNYLLKYLNPQVIVVGHDFHFGKGRGGSFETLARWCQQKGIEAQQVLAYQLEEQNVSSTRIRELLREGNLAAAHELLGRNYYVKGKVAPGEGRGKKLGFPTANIAAPEGLPLSHGVYVTEVICGGQRFKAVTNVGLNPTFEDAHRNTRIESFIFGLNKKLYDEIIQVEFFKFLRPERKFRDAQELIEQIQLDVKEAHEYWE